MSENALGKCTDITYVCRDPLSDSGTVANFTELSAHRHGGLDTTADGVRQDDEDVGNDNGETPCINNEQTICLWPAHLSNTSLW
jgi:hypothetical protein